MAATQGNSSAQYNLGICYQYGRGTQKDETEAFSWYTKAANDGHVSSQLKLGDMYLSGEGTGKDETEALNWYKKAADQNNARAQYELGVMYFNGQGTAKNTDTAKAWWKKAAEQDYSQDNVVVEYQEILTYRRNSICRDCNGTGRCHDCGGSGKSARLTKIKCPSCDGTGFPKYLKGKYKTSKNRKDPRYYCTTCYGKGIVDGHEKCWTCNGTGRCRRCNGTGRLY